MALRSSNRLRNEWAVGLLDVQPTDRVLELGFGPGIAIRALARRATRGLVVGVDHSGLMVSQARRRNAAAVREGRVDLRLAGAESLPEFDAPFDKMLAVNSMGFWPEPIERLKKLRSLLREGGVIAIVRQPRVPTAASETAEGNAAELVGMLTEAGFGRMRTETLDLKPPVVCVLGINDST
jgi:SAM-dependent methyltransferase